MLKALFTLPRTVWLIGLISLLNDSASEMIYPLAPLYLASVLMAGPRALGVIEGIAEATASLLKLFSGAVVGPFLAALLLGLGWALFGLFAFYGVFMAATEGVERALVADLAPKALLGTAFGWFNLTAGILLLPASLVFGELYQQAGALTAFAFSTTCALTAAILLPLWALRGTQPPSSIQE